ncbi:MAG: hypothetical protein NZ959_03745 [Armatimonadetes bacterium]|nr:hypothetical protein [Armatimonadota bacterium]MDW8121755.1 hypothetical protein [Armatimonadota bacterium]
MELIDPAVLIFFGPLLLIFLGTIHQVFVFPAVLSMGLIRSVEVGMVVTN